MNLFFPQICHACSILLEDNELHICTKCRHDLPVTNFHFNNDKTMEKILYGRVKTENVTALLKFEKKGLVQQLIHGLKHKGIESTGVFLGKWLGGELKTIDSYKDIDIIIPVPLHRRKLKKRGYNQVQRFGEEIALALEIPFVDSVLHKITSAETQVFKKRIARWDNAQEVFQLKNIEVIQGKHILLVDDIITTGATIEACANELLKARDVKISIATMAIAG